LESIGYFHFSFWRNLRWLLPLSVCSPTVKVLQAAAVPRHTTFGLHGAYCPYCRYIYGPANLYYICTALYKSLYKR
jgi:hypothetical protein